ncbi:MAG: hypothetical protein IJV37_05530 [Bacteroidales bacterium]|nr:hypothetical protein [Bacteroidales bacterium]
MTEELIDLASRDREWKDASGRIQPDRDTLLALHAFGALYWSTDDIAAWFGITDLAWWQGEVANRMSWISRAIRQGELQHRAKVELKILQGAENGCEEDVSTYRSMMRDKSFALSKQDLFGGAEDESLWQKIQDYIANGSPGTLSAKEQNYLDLLNLIFSLDGQFGKRRVVQFLTKEPFGFSHAQAANLYAEAVELFHANRKVSREALRDKTADMFDTLYHAAVAAAKSTADYTMAADILAKKSKLLRLDQEEVQKLDPAVYQRFPTIVDASPESIGLPRADRRVLAEIIKKLPVPETEKKRLAMDAGVIDMDIEKMLQHESQEAGKH